MYINHPAYVKCPMRRYGQISTIVTTRYVPEGNTYPLLLCWDWYIIFADCYICTWNPLCFSKFTTPSYNIIPCFCFEREIHLLWQIKMVVDDDKMNILTLHKNKTMAIIIRAVNRLFSKLFKNLIFKMQISNHSRLLGHLW